MNDNNFRRRLMFTSLYSPEKLMNGISVPSVTTSIKGNHSINGYNYSYYGPVYVINNNNVGVILTYQFCIFHMSNVDKMTDNKFSYSPYKIHTATLKAHEKLQIGYYVSNEETHWIEDGDAIEIKEVKKA